MSKTISEEEARQRMEEEAEKFCEEDFEKIKNKKSRLDEIFSEGPLAKFIDDLGLLFLLLSDYFGHRYTEIPWRSIVAVGGTLLYALNPFDLIPDVIPVIGLLDDAAVIAACLKVIRIDLEKYRVWKVAQ